MNYKLTTSCTSVTVGANPPSPQPVGGMVTFTATGSGCGEYQFWVRTGGVWSVRQDWSSSTTFNWNTAGLAPGRYDVSVWARAAGSTEVREATVLTSYQLN